MAYYPLYKESKDVYEYTVNYHSHSRASLFTFSFRTKYDDELSENTTTSRPFQAWGGLDILKELPLAKLLDCLHCIFYHKIDSDLEKNIKMVCLTPFTLHIILQYAFYGL